MTTETAQPGITSTGEPVKVQELTVWGALQANLRDYGLLLALILIMLFFQYFTAGVLFKPVNGRWLFHTRKIAFLSGAKRLPIGTLPGDLPWNE